MYKAWYIFSLEHEEGVDQEKGVAVMRLFVCEKNEQTGWMCSFGAVIADLGSTWHMQRSN